MATTFELASKFMAILDEIYQAASLTARMDALTKPVDFGGANEVKIFKTSMVGLGTYSRTDGYPDGDVNGTWETLALAIERGRAFSVDRQDNDETLGMAFGTLVGEFLRTKVIPEVDAIRFAKYAAGAGNAASPTTLSSSTVLAAIDAAGAVLDAAEVPQEGRLLYVSNSIYGFIKAAVTRVLANENGVDRRVQTLDGIDVIMVPQARFYTALTLDPGSSSSAGGFTKDSVYGKDINFILMHPSARDQAVKQALPKIFDPDTNQSKDSWLFQYRIYHDAWVYENKDDGIYLHNKS
jgi:hypothetical protein